MADINKLVPLILKWEGSKYTNDPLDPGGPTKYGVTLKTWKSKGKDKDGDGDIDANDVKLLDVDDLKLILKIGYWDLWRADKIKDQNVANILVDWVYNSGVPGIKIPQKLLGVPADGEVGPQTLKALNAQDPISFHQAVFAARKKFYEDIVKNKPSQKKWIKGWMNRLNDFKYK